MTCGDVRLEEYLDGELGEPDRAVVETHLASCAACSAELAAVRNLEKILRSVPARSIPDAERFVQRVHAGSRSGGRVWIGLAAALLVGAVALLVRPPADRVDVRAELASYAARPNSAAEARLRDAGPAAYPVLEAAMRGSDARVQFAAASLLFKLADRATADRVLAGWTPRPEGNGGALLADTGGDSTDIEMLPVAVSALELQGQERWAVDVLRKLQWLSREAQGRVAGSVVTLLKHENPRIQKLALDIADELDIEFPLAALVDLLDSPELGDKALKVLRDATGKDFPKDKDAWRKAVLKKEAP